MKTGILTIAVLAGSVILAFAFGPQEEPAPEVSDVRPPEEQMRRMDDGTIRLGEISLDPRTREISFQAYLKPPKQGDLEILIASKNYSARLHETLLVTSASAYQLEALLLAMGADNKIKREGKNKRGSDASSTLPRGKSFSNSP